MSKMLGIIASVLAFATLTAEKASANSEVVRSWATSNGATWMVELEPVAQVVATGEAATLTLPEGSVAPWVVGVSGYRTLDEALASLGPAPTRGLVAAYAYTRGATWNAGYVSIAEVVQTIVVETTIPVSTVPRNTAKTTDTVVEEVTSLAVEEETSLAVEDVSTTSTVPEPDDSDFTVSGEATEVVTDAQNQKDVRVIEAPAEKNSLSDWRVRIFFILVGGAAPLIIATSTALTLLPSRRKR